MLSKGNYYKFKGKRDIEDFKNFIEGGFKDAEEQGSIPAPPGIFESFIETMKEAFLEVFEAIDPIFA